MTNTNNDIHELEELLTELEGQEARLVTPYSEDDDAVTTLIEAPLSDQEWMVQVTALDRRMMGTEQVVAEWRAGKINGKTLIWRTGMNDWTPIGSVSELRNARELVAGPEIAAPAPVQRASYAPAPPAALPLPPPVARPAGLNTTLPSSPVSAPPPSWTANPAPAAAAPSWGTSSASSTSATSWGSSSAPAAPVPPVAQARVPTLPSSVSPVVPSPSSAPRPNAGNVTLPGKLVAVKPITAPPTAVAVPDFVPSQTNSTRPVEVDYPEPSSRGGGSKKVFIGLGAVAVAALVVTFMALSGGDDEQAKASPEPGKAAVAQPQAVLGLNPTPEKNAPAQITADPAPAAEPMAKAGGPSSASESGATSAAAMVSPSRSSAKASTRYVSRESGASASAASRRNKEAQDEPAAEPAVARSEEAEAPAAPAAPVAQDEPAGSEGEDGVVSQEPEDSKLATPGGKRFDKEAAANVLNDAADKAKNCRPKGGPTGKGRVRIRYEPNGKVSSVSVLTSKFENTVAGSCVTMLFRRANVPAFNGGAVVVNKSFEIP
jgi:hypothetical protein